MGFWDRVKSIYRKADTAVGGYLPGGVSPSKSSTSTTSTSTPSAPSTTSTSTSSGGGGGSVSSTSLPPKQLEPVRSVDYQTSTGQSAGGTTYYGKSVWTGGTSTGSTTPSNVPYVQQGTTQEQVLTASTTQVKDKPVYVSDKRKTVTQYGALFVTPQEAKQLEGGSLAYWKIESTNTQDAIKEAQFAGNVPYRSPGAFRSRGTYEYNVQNIIAGKQIYNQYQDISKEFKADPSKFEGKEGVTTTKTEEGISYQLSPSYFEKNIDIENIYKSSLSETKTQFSNLPQKTKDRLNIGGYAQGVTSAGLGIGEFVGTVGTNIGVQTYKEGEFGQKRRFYFGGSLGDIRSAPSTQATVKFTEAPIKYIGQKATTPEALGQATVIVPLISQGAKSVYTNIKTFGFKGGVAETASGFSPLRVKSGIYGEVITSKTRFTDVKSIKATNKEGITTRVYSGSSGSIKLSGVEKSINIGGQRYGAGYTSTQTPYTEIRAGGSIIKSGVRTTISPYSFKPTGSGKVYSAKTGRFYNEITSDLFKGGTSQILTSKGITAYSSGGKTNIYSSFAKGYKSTGGGAIEKVTPGVSKFISGSTKPIYKTTSYGDRRINLDTGSTSRDFIRSPSGRYKLKPKLSGVEIDLNKLIGGTKTRYKSTGGGGSSTKSVLKLQSSSLTTPVIPATKPIIKSSPKVVPPPQTKGTQAQALKPSIKSVGVKVATPDLKTKTAVKGDTINVVLPKPISRSGSRSKTQLKPLVTPVLDLDTLTKSKGKTDTLTAVKIIQVQKVKLDTAQRSAITGFGGVPSPTVYKFPTTPTTPIPFNLPLLSGVPSGSLGLGKVKGKRPETRYVPSFSALYFKIKGKAPKGRATGLRLRPITPKFSLFGKKKVKRVKRVKRK